MRGSTYCILVIGFVPRARKIAATRASDARELAVQQTPGGLAEGGLAAEFAALQTLQRGGDDLFAVAVTLARLLRHCLDRIGGRAARLADRRLVANGGHVCALPLVLGALRAVAVPFDPTVVSYLSDVH